MNNHRISTKQPKAVVFDAAAMDITGLFSIFEKLHDLNGRSAVRNVHIEDAPGGVQVRFEIANIYRALVIRNRRRNDFR